jgi:ABC-type transport system substrate-binding protein
LIQKDWEKIGVKVKLLSYEHSDFFRRLHKGEIVDKKTRIKLYNQAQKILAEEKPVTPLFNKMDFDVAHQSIKGYTIPVLDPRRYTGISIE